MEAKEIRVGNFLHIPNGHPYAEVTGLTNTGKIWFVPEPQHEECAWASEEVKPIPLTEAWLIKFGFTFQSTPSSYGYDCNKAFNGGVIRGAYNKYTDGKWYFLQHLIRGVHMEIKFVHELQNLYWCLTREELQLNND